jgi:hypothetical protein
MLELHQMLRFFAPFLCCLAMPVFGQLTATDLFEKAPPAVEEALKSRVTAFFEAQMAKKYRVADQYVATESKDEFFGADKATCRTSTYVKSVFSDNYTKAQVVTLCEVTFSHTGQRTLVKMPLTSFWKVLDGQWFWYMPPMPEYNETPFGKMKLSEVKPGESEPAQPSFRIPKPEEILSQIKLSKPSCLLDSMKISSDEISVTNGTPGTITLALQVGMLPGFSAKLDKSELKPGETTVVHLNYKPSSQMKPDVALDVRVDPFGGNISIPVIFTKPNLTQQPK